MPNYKEMYLKMFHATEQAIDILIAAQRECEEMYISAQSAPPRVIELPPKSKKGVDKE